MSPFQLDEFCNWIYVARRQKLTLLGIYVLNTQLHIFIFIDIQGVKRERETLDGELLSEVDFHCESQLLDVSIDELPLEQREEYSALNSLWMQVEFYQTQKGI